MTPVDSTLGHREYNAFFAYNTEERHNVEAVCAAMSNRGLRIWMDIRCMVAGDNLRTAIGRGIQSSEKAVIFVGQSGLGSWQGMELSDILSTCDTRKMPCIPVYLPGVTRLPEEPSYFGLPGLLPVVFHRSTSEANALTTLEAALRGHAFCNYRSQYEIRVHVPCVRYTCFVAAGEHVDASLFNFITTAAAAEGLHILQPFDGRNQDTYAPTVAASIRGANSLWLT